MPTLLSKITLTCAILLAGDGSAPSTTEQRLAAVRAALERTDCPVVPGTIDIGRRREDGRRPVTHSCRGPKDVVKPMVGLLTEAVDGVLAYAPAPLENIEPRRRVPTEKRIEFVRRNFGGLTECALVPGSIDFSPMSGEDDIYVTERVKFQCTLESRRYAGEARLFESGRHELAWLISFTPDPILGEKLTRGFKLTPLAGH